MREIIVPKPKSDSFVSHFGAFYSAFKDLNWGERVDFNLAALDWVCPILVLPLAAYSLENKLDGLVSSESPVVRSYLDAIKFPQGIDSVSELEAFAQQCKSYLPVSILKKNLGEERSRLETIFEQMVYNVIADIEGARSAVYYPITELVSNIFDHSGKDEGYIFAQRYPKKEYLEICIVDCGCGLSGTYKEAKGLVLSGVESINEVMKGNSTKSNKERGFGVWTSKRVVCEGFDGDFALISNDAALVASRGEEKLVSLPGFNWHGVIIAYRIPRPKAPVDITNYIPVNHYLWITQPPPRA